MIATTAKPKRLYNRDEYISTAKIAATLYKSGDQTRLEELVMNLSEEEGRIEKRLRLLDCKQPSFEEPKESIQEKSILLAGKLRGTMEAKAPVAIMLHHLRTGMTLREDLDHSLERGEFYKFFISPLARAANLCRESKENSGYEDIYEDRLRELIERKDLEAISLSDESSRLKASGEKEAAFKNERRVNYTIHALKIMVRMAKHMTGKEEILLSPGYVDSGIFED